MEKSRLRRLELEQSGVVQSLVLSIADSAAGVLGVMPMERESFKYRDTWVRLSQPATTVGLDLLFDWLLRQPKISISHVSGQFESVSLSSASNTGVQMFWRDDHVHSGKDNRVHKHSRTAPI